MKPITDIQSLLKPPPATQAAATPAPALTALSPAVVVKVERDGVSVRLADGRVIEAQMALAYSYSPVVGDTLLTIGDAAGHYVIGVISGRGRISLRAGGDVDIESERGSVRLRAGEGVDIDAPQVVLRAAKLRTFASSVVERANEWVRSVRDALSVQAGSSHTVIEGTHHVQASDHNLIARDKVRVNGKAIHLG